MGSVDDPGRPSGSHFQIKPASWQYAIVGLMIFLFYVIGIFVEYRNLTHDPIISRDRFRVETQITGAERWWLIGLMAIGFFVLPWVVPITMYLIPRFAIRENGLLLNRADGRLTPWDQIESCHWNRYPPAGMLTVQIPQDRVTIFIPERHRVRVEAELRRSGKWRD